MKPYQVHETIRRLIDLQELVAKAQVVAGNCLNVLDHGHWLKPEIENLKAYLDTIPACHNLLDRLVRELGAETLRKEQKTEVDRLRKALAEIAERSESRSPGKNPRR